MKRIWNMGNRVPQMIPIKDEYYNYINNSYKIIKVIYLRKSTLGGNYLALNPLEESELGSDKFRINQYTVLPGSVIENIQASIPKDNIGFGFLDPVNFILNGTLCMDGKKLEGVDIKEIVNSDENILELI